MTTTTSVERAVARPPGSHAKPGGRRTRALLNSATVGVFVLALGLVMWGLIAPSPVSPARPEAGAGPSPSAPSQPKYVALSPSAPQRLIIRSLGVDAPIVPIFVNTDRALIPPKDADQVGWWEESARPGSTKGRTIIAGHTLYSGAGALTDIESIRIGARLDIKTKKGLMRYRVVNKADLSYEEVAEQAEALFGQHRGGGSVLLVTCTDFDGVKHNSNAMVLAVPLGQPNKTAPEQTESETVTSASSD